MNRPSELCTVGGTYQQRRPVPAGVGTHNLGIVRKKWASVEGFANIAL